MEAPSSADIARLKEEHQDRALHLVELKSEGDEEKYYLVMKGPTEDEYKIFVDDTFIARDKAKNDQDKSERMRLVATNVIIRQAVWPARQEIKDLLFKHPGFVMQVADKVHEHAGSSAEVRSKKL
jgi:hypothetical protein